MKIKLWIDPRDEKKFVENFRKFLNEQAKNCQETIMIKGKLVVQEESEFSKAWFYHIEKEKKK
jgi:hypothetical protein